MAKLIGPLHSTEARGVIGGLIFNTWRGIRYCKRMTSPAQPRTKTSLIIRAQTIFCVRAWKALELADQAAWNDYAKDHPLIDWTGVAKRITGCNWFVALGVRLLRMGEELNDIPPIVDAPDALDAFDAADGVGESILTWTAREGTTDHVEIWLYGPHSVGKQGKIERARFHTSFAGEGGTGTLSSLNPGHYTVFGRVIDENTGLASLWASDTCDIT